MERYTARSFFKDNPTIADEAYFNSINECQNWCYEEHKANFEQMYFEIHHSVGALTYYKAEITIGVFSINWKEIEYEQKDIPLICPWWKITELPEKLR